MITINLQLFGGRGSGGGNAKESAVSAANQNPVQSQTKYNTGVSEKNERVAKNYLSKVVWKKAGNGQEQAEIAANQFSYAKLSNEKMLQVLNRVDSKYVYRLEQTEEKRGYSRFRHTYIIREKR